MCCKIAACYPWSPPFVFTAFVDSALNLRSPPDCEVKWFRGIGWASSRRRTDACEKALEWNADLIFSLDPDQVYEEDTLCRLLERHQNGCEIIAAMVPQRGYVASSGIKPFGRLAWNIDNGCFVPVDPDDGELLKVDLPTSAAMLYPADLLRKLRRPWFMETYNKRTWKRIHAEDSRFVHRLTQELGVSAWVDTTIKVKHAHVFEIDETYAERFADWEEPGCGDPVVCRYD